MTTLSLSDIRNTLNRPKITYISMKRKGALIVEFGNRATYNDAVTKLNQAFPEAYRLYYADKQMLLNTPEEITYFKMIANSLDEN